MDTDYITDILNNSLSGCTFDLQPPAVPPAPAKLTKPSKINAWDPRFILDLAVGVDDQGEILERYGLTMQEYELLLDTPSFRRELALTMRDVRENGAPFAAKARVQAESYLSVIDEIVCNTATPASIRLEAIRSTVKWGKLEPKDTADSAAGNQPTINVQINF